MLVLMVMAEEEGQEKQRDGLSSQCPRLRGRGEHSRMSAVLLSLAISGARHKLRGSALTWQKVTSSLHSPIRHCRR